MKKTNKKICYGLLIISMLAYQSYISPVTYKDILFDSYISRKIFLNEYAYKCIDAIESNSKDIKENLILYFRAFPHDFKTLFGITHEGLEGDMLYVTYYSYIYAHNPWGKFYPIVKEVKSEEEIPKEKLTEKNMKDAEKIVSRFNKEYKKEWGGGG